MSADNIFIAFNIAITVIGFASLLVWTALMIIHEIRISKRKADNKVRQAELDAEAREAREKAEAERQQAEEQERAEKSATNTRLLEEAGEKLQEARMLCVEKCVNIFDYLAIQEDIKYLMQHVTPEDIKRDWTSKKPLRIWAEMEWTSNNIVFSSSTRSFEEYDELFKLVGGRWFSWEAKVDYTIKAPSALKKVLLTKELWTDEKINKAQVSEELYSQLPIAKSIEEVDEIKKAIHWLVNFANDEEVKKYQELDPACQKARYSIINDAVMATEDTQELKLLVYQARKYFGERRGISLESRWSDISLEIERKRLSLIDDPAEVPLDPGNLHTLQDLQDMWFKDHIEACDQTQLDELWTKMSEQQQLRYGEKVNRRSIELSLE